MKSSKLATVFITMIALSGLAMLGWSTLQIHTLHWAQLISLLAISTVTARMKVKLPGMDSNMAVNLPFILIAAVQVGLFEAAAVAMVSTAAQSLPSAGKFQPVKMLFNVSTVVLAAGATGMVWHSAWMTNAVPELRALPLVAACSMFFLTNTLPVATIISLTEGSRLLSIWVSIVHLSFPYYLASTGITSIILAMSGSLAWQAPLVILPMMLLMYRCYRLYLGRSADAVPMKAKAHGAGAR
jgi:hypothetical protein